MSTFAALRFTASLSGCVPIDWRAGKLLAQPVEHYTPATNADPQSLSAMLHHGDVLLTEGNTRVAALVKRITQSTWSHVSMYWARLKRGPIPVHRRSGHCGGRQTVRLSS